MERVGTVSCSDKLIGGDDVLSPISIPTLNFTRGVHNPSAQRIPEALQSRLLKLIGGHLTGIQIAIAASKKANVLRQVSY